MRKMAQEIPLPFYKIKSKIDRELRRRNSKRVAERKHRRSSSLNIDFGFRREVAIGGAFDQIVSAQKSRRLQIDLLTCWQEETVESFSLPEKAKRIAIEDGRFGL